MDSELKNLIGEFEKIAKETKKVEVVDENKVNTSTPDNSVQNLMTELSNVFKESKKKILPKKIEVQESDLSDFFSVMKEAKTNATWPNELPPEKPIEEKAPNTADAMKRFKSGKAGFTDKAHLKAKGLIPRADGTKKKSPKYEEPEIKVEDVENLFGSLLDINEAPRIPRKKGQPAGSDKHSDLYTDENPKGTIHGLKFATVKDAKASVKKIEGSGKTHAHKIQAAVAMEQRAREMGKTAQADVYRAYIEKMKKITKKRQKNENIVEDVAEQIKNTAPKFKPQQHDIYETEITNLDSLKQEFIKFKARTIEQLGSLGGGGEVNFAKLDDVNTDGQEDGDVLTYNATTDKYELKSSTSTTSSGQLLLDQDGSNVVLNATDSSGTSDGDDILLESGVGGSRDLDFTVLQNVTSDIIPQQGGTFNLGSETHRFKSIFLEADTIDLDGATIKSDGSGQLTISADGATLPAGSKDTDGKELLTVVAETTTSSVLTAQPTKSVPLFTQSGGLTTAAATFTFAKTLSRRSVYTNSGHTFLLSNGDSRTDASVELFEF